jgi:hypothetical protein
MVTIAAFSTFASHPGMTVVGRLKSSPIMKKSMRGGSRTASNRPYLVLHRLLE